MSRSQPVSLSLVAQPTTVLKPSMLQLKQGNKTRGIQYAHTVRACTQQTSALLLKTTSSIRPSSSWLGYATAAWSITKCRSARQCKHYDQKRHKSFCPSTSVVTLTNDPPPFHAPNNVHPPVANVNSDTSSNSHCKLLIGYLLSLPLLVPLSQLYYLSSED